MKAFFIIFSLISSNVFATCDLDGKEIMDKVVTVQSANSEHEIQQLFLVDVKSNVKEKRTIERFSIDDSKGNSKSLIMQAALSRLTGDDNQS